MGTIKLLLQYVQQATLREGGTLFRLERIDCGQGRMPPLLVSLHSSSVCQREPLSSLSQRLSRFRAAARKAVASGAGRSPNDRPKPWPHFSCPWRRWRSFRAFSTAWWHHPKAPHEMEPAPSPTAMPLRWSWTVPAGPWRRTPTCAPGCLALAPASASHHRRSCAKRIKSGSRPPWRCTHLAELGQEASLRPQAE